MAGSDTFRCLLRTLGGTALAAVALLGAACKRPEAALRERPAQRLELVQRVRGMTAEEESELRARLARGLGLVEPAPAAGRVLKVTLEGGPDPDADRGAAVPALRNTGLGLLYGALLVGTYSVPFGSLQAVAYGAGAGGLVGLGVSPGLQRKRQEQQRTLGYVPWRLRADWDVVQRGPDGVETMVARRENGFPWGRYGWTTFDLAPHLQPLPPDRRGEAEVRRASLRALAEALLQRLGGRPADQEPSTGQ